MSIRETVDSISLIDNHAHAVAPLTSPDAFPDFFSEAPNGCEHARHTLYYRAGLQLLRDRFDGETEAELLEQRYDVDLQSYTHELLSDAGVGTILADTGIPDVPIEEFRTYTDAGIHPILRIETIIEELLPEHDEFDVLETAFEERIEAALGGEHVGLKSVIAYRSGLDVSPADRSAAAAAFESVSANWDGRIEHPDLLEYLVHRACDLAGEYDAPVQFHTGFGDPDAHPNEVDPGLMYDLMHAHESTDFVLLHASYPYVQKASYVVSVVENAYLDVGLAIPFVYNDAEQVLREAMELAPTTKLLYSSDAYCVPEWYYLGAVRGREALSTVLEELLDAGRVSESYAEQIAHNVLRENAVTLYDL